MYFLLLSSIFVMVMADLCSRGVSGTNNRLLQYWRSLNVVVIVFTLVDLKELFSYGGCMVMY